ncbi:MAG: deoxyribodipyrimidine photo-lyase [Phycisphaerales bacterium]|nr:deoxyribodipyrimidine photo-lyase [Phycisphaerales bacterium]
MRALMWFRSDLRVADNTALAAACDAADEVVGVFVVAPQQWRSHDWGAMRVDFTVRSVEALRHSLAKLNIPLIVLRVDRFADAPAAVSRFAKAAGCGGVWWNDEPEVNEIARDSAVEAALSAIDVKAHRFIDQTILDVSTIRTASDQWYTVFTPFRRRWLEHWRDSGAVIAKPPARRAAVSLDDSALCGLPLVEPGALLDIVAEFEGTTRSDLWKAGEGEARQRLSRFIDERVGDYDNRRDFMAVNGTSVLSPYLAVGAISARQCFEAARETNRGKADGGKKGIDTWISELIWREFYRHVLMGFPHVCRGRAFRREVDEAVEWRYDEGDFRRWQSGESGYPIVDAAMRQLAQTGWMHNRARMIVAMFLSKHLLIDWRWGERHFMRHLVDGDFASNNGGWQWSASTGTDAAPYFRIFNPFSQSAKFDSDGAYIRRFVPELAKAPAAALHDPDKLADADLDYPALVVDHPAGRARALAAFKQASRHDAR